MGRGLIEYLLLELVSSLSDTEPSISIVLYKGVIMNSRALRLPLMIGAAAVAVSLVSCSAAVQQGGGDGGSTGGEAQVIAADMNPDPNPPTVWTGPTSSPPAQPGKKVTIVSCINTSPAAHELALGAKEGADALGWESTIVDGKAQTTVQISAIEAAVNAKVDGIITICIDPPTIPTALQAAKDAGIPVVSASAPMLDDPLIAAFASYPSVGYGKLVADWIIEDSGGKGKVVVIDVPNSAAGTLTQRSMVEQIEANCPDCEIVEKAEITLADAFSPKLGSLIRTLEQRHGESMEYLTFPFSGMWGQAGPAVRDIGRADLKVATYDGDAVITQACQEGLVQAVASFHLKWNGWAAADQMNRVLAGEEPVFDVGIPAYMMTADNCQGIADAGELVKVDFAAEYEKLWGTRD